MHSPAEFFLCGNGGAGGRGGGGADVGLGTKRLQWGQRAADVENMGWDDDQWSLQVRPTSRAEEQGARGVGVVESGILSLQLVLLGRDCRVLPPDPPPFCPGTPGQHGAHLGPTTHTLGPWTMVVAPGRRRWVSEVRWVRLRPHKGGPPAHGPQCQATPAFPQRAKCPGMLRTTDGGRLVGPGETRNPLALCCISHPCQYVWSRR